MVLFLLAVPRFYWQFNYDAPGQTGFFLHIHFEYFCLTSFFPSVFTSHSASNSQVSEVSKILFTFFMMSEVRWTAVENFSMRSIVIKLPVMLSVVFPFLLIIY